MKNNKQIWTNPFLKPNTLLVRLRIKFIVLLMIRYTRLCSWKQLDFVYLESSKSQSTFEELTTRHKVSCMHVTLLYIITTKQQGSPSCTSCSTLQRGGLPEIIPELDLILMLEDPCYNKYVLSLRRDPLQQLAEASVNCSSFIDNNVCTP